MSDAIYIQHDGGSVRVFKRGDGNGLAQVGQFVSAAAESPDPLRVLTLMSDLDDLFGWTGNGTLTAASTSPVSALPTPRRGGPPSDGEQVRAAIMETISERGPLTIPQLGGEQYRYHVKRLERERMLVVVDQTPTGADMYDVISGAKSPPPRPPVTRASHAEVERRRERIIEIVSASPTPLTAPQITRALGLSRSGDSFVRKQATRLAEHGVLTRSEIGGRSNGLPLYGYALPPPSPSSEHPSQRVIDDLDAVPPHSQESYLDRAEGES